MDAPRSNILRELTHQSVPEVLNFQVNDICNARCVMCQIWQNKRGLELSPEEFASLLKQPFFQGVKHVGITGGEPTLRSDLASFYHVLPANLPAFSGASFITNGFKTSEAIQTYSEVHDSYRSLGKSFSGMVSLDGLGEIHDRVRGREGSFARATATLSGLREAGVPVQAACTIVRSNVWGLADLLDWARSQGIYIRFRVGTFIRRLYNSNLKTELHAFSEAENKHLVAFFHRLLLEYETEEGVKRTYTSILSRLTGGVRLVTCPYQTNHSLNFDSSGRFATCAPKGRPFALASGRTRGTARIFERLAIRTFHCPTCTHDYHGDWTVNEKALAAARATAAAELATTPASAHLPPVLVRPIRRLLVLGWYGTETAGDIAILGGLFQRYAAQGVRSFTVLSLFPFYSRTTLLPLASELGIRLAIESYDSPHVINGLAAFDAVTMGGGPLMDLEQTRLILAFFRKARALGRPCFLDGCGVGPLQHERFRAVVSQILELSTGIRLRDTNSLALAKMLVPPLQAEVVLDPSHTYLLQTGVRWRPGPHGVIRVFFRELTFEYPQSIPLETANALVPQVLEKILAWYPEHRIELCAMHWFPVGLDDRDFATRLARQIDNPRVSVDCVPRTPRELLERMASADLNLCMRFHSIVFAHAIGAPFVPFDYTAGGKIHGFLCDKGISSLAIRYGDIPTLGFENFTHRICRSAS